MTAQPHYETAPGPVPPMRTLAELRDALATHGLPGDRIRFDVELGAVDLDDLTSVREIVQAYRHRVLMRHDTGATAAITRSDADIAAELRRKMEAGAR
ncbi:hypothetical protein AB0C52_24425 [Streptomyces sp. NPDC048717]|uniref:hypothetical protein n=1 Tax=Streptomyces sp. NPDC048717 TaxID=3154928 RepID=UPI00341A4502